MANLFSFGSRHRGRIKRVRTALIKQRHELQLVRADLAARLKTLPKKAFSRQEVELKEAMAALDAVYAQAMSVIASLDAPIFQEANHGQPSARPAYQVPASIVTPNGTDWPD